MTDSLDAQAAGTWEILRAARWVFILRSPCADGDPWIADWYPYDGASHWLSGEGPSAAVAADRATLAALQAMDAALGDSVLDAAGTAMLDESIAQEQAGVAFVPVQAEEKRMEDKR